MGVDRWRGAIVMVVFGQVGLSVVKIRYFELFGVVEKHLWS